MANNTGLIREIERAIGFVQEYEFLASDSNSAHVLSTLQRARDALNPPDCAAPKTIYLLEEGLEILSWSWCEDPDPDGEDRQVFEYRLVGAYTPEEK